MEPETQGREEIRRARWLADGSLEAWRSHLDERDVTAAARRHRLEELAGDVERIRAITDSALDLSVSHAERSEVLEEQVEPLARDELLPAIDALVAEQRRLVEREIESSADLTRIFQLLTYAFSVLVVLASLGALFSLQSSILRPISDLRSAVSQFRRGTDEVRVTVRSNDEIGRLGTEFNATAKELVEARRALEARTRAAEEARRQTEVASRIKTEFLANLSHEIRTPINGLAGCTELMSATDLDADQRQYYELIRQSLAGLTAVVDDVLDASKLLTGRIYIETVPFKLRQDVTDVVELRRPKAQSKGLALRLHMAEDVPGTVLGDPARIRQVLLQLIDNALKFTAQGEIEVDVVNESPGEETARLRVDVRDTGVGIPEDQQGRIFDPFTQVDSSTTRHYGGSGLGLSISRQLVELMGGHLQVTSRLDEGSTFSLTVELRRLDLLQSGS